MAEARALIGVAIPVPEPYADELEDWRSSFGDPQAHAIPAHITLLPPTSVAEAELPAVEAHLREAATAVEPFPVHLRGTGTFRPVSPVVFVALAAGIAGCERLERGVRRGRLTRALDFPYHPHVTVAHDLPDEVLDEAYDALAGYDARFVVDRFHLYVHGDDGVWQPRTTLEMGG